MKIIEPEVAGQIGEETQGDFSAHPPVVTKLHYAFDGWLGDEIVQTFPCFLITRALADTLREEGVTGWEVRDAQISTSEEFEEMFEDVELPEFLWFQVNGAQDADIQLSDDGRLLVSERAWAIMEPRLGNAIVD